MGGGFAGPLMLDRPKKETSSTVRSIQRKLDVSIAVKIDFSPHLYYERNAIERMFGRLKEFRRIATRYD